MPEIIVPLPAAALLEPSPLLLPGLRLLPAALWLLRLRENRTLLSRGLLPLLLLGLLRTLLLLLLCTLLLWWLLCTLLLLLL